METVGSNSDFARRIRQVADPDASNWSPEDFVRASQRSSQEFLYGREIEPEASGTLRFHGDGVKGHTLAMRTAGLAMTAWQKLVTDVFAASQGFRNVRGPLPGAVQAFATLHTHARALPGSVVFDFLYGEPEGDQARLFEAGTASRIDPVAETLQFLNTAEQSARNLESSEFVVVARDLGPRATSSLRAFSELLSSQSLDLDAEIHPRFERARTVKTSAEAFKAIVSKIDRGDVLHEHDILEGTLLSLSARKRELEIKYSDEDYVRVSVRNVDLAPYSIGQRVRVRATSEWKTSATGESTVKFDADWIEILDAPR